MQQNQCKATSSRSANSDEQIKGWILLLLHHDPQDKIKSFTDTRERISGRGKKLFDIRKVFSTRWDCQFGSLPGFFCGTLLGVGSLDPLQGVRCLGCSFRSPPGVRCLGCSLDPLQGVRCDPQHGALGGRLRGFTAARLKCVKKNFLGPEKFFFLPCLLTGLWR